MIPIIGNQWVAFVLLAILVVCIGVYMIVDWGIDDDEDCW